MAVMGIFGQGKVTAEYIGAKERVEVFYLLDANQR